MFLTELQTRQKRQMKNTEGDQMPVKPSIAKRSEKKYDSLSRARPAVFIAPRASGEDEADLVKEALQVNMDHLGHRE